MSFHLIRETSLTKQTTLLFLVFFFFFFLRFFCFGVDHLKNLYGICYNIVSVLCFGFLAMWQLGAQLPNQCVRPALQVKPATPALEGEILATGPPGKSLLLILILPLNFTFLNISEN